MMKNDVADQLKDKMLHYLCENESVEIGIEHKNEKNDKLEKQHVLNEERESDEEKK